jgi:hypothetical protein
VCKCLLESMRYSNSLSENCEGYISGFSVEVVSAEECGGEARSRTLRDGPYSDEISGRIAHCTIARLHMATLCIL